MNIRTLGPSFALAAAVVAGLLAAPAGAAPPVLAINATADQKFVPDHVTLHAGRTQILRFSSSSGVHGIVSDALGIPATTIDPDKPVTLSVTPSKAGTFKLACTIVCGPGHADMALTVTVVK